MKTKTIVFDLDDTLVKEIDYLKSAFLEIACFLDSNNKLLFEEMFQWYQNKENVFNNLEKLYVKADKQLLLRIYHNHFPNFNSNTEIKQILINLKNKGYFLGLLTDGYSITQRNKIKALAIDNLFDLIVISEEFGSEKPNLKNYEIFHQFNTEEYYYIGDNVSKDFITPNKLCWKTICLLDDGENIHKQDFKRESIYLPSIIIKKISELNFTNE
jgi:putative hydrolase of the HAD superfamily